MVPALAVRRTSTRRFRLRDGGGCCARSLLRLGSPLTSTMAAAFCASAVASSSSTRPFGTRILEIVAQRRADKQEKPENFFGRFTAAAAPAHDGAAAALPPPPVVSSQLLLL